MKRSAWFGLVIVSSLVAWSTATADVPIPLNRWVTAGQPGLQNEEQMWICPTDTTITIINHRDFRLGYRQIGLGRSTTNGLIWIDTLIHPDYQIFPRQSDPVMTVNSSGDIIMCYLDYDPNYDDRSHLAFLVSDDCGETWAGPTTVSPTTGFYFEDKQFITCDRTGGTYDGNVYISWTRFPNPDRIMFARSTDGTQTFEDTILVGPTTTSTCYGGPIDAGQFSQPLVGKDGAVYVFWQAMTIDSTGGCEWCRSIRFNKSTDGGVTWQGDRHVRCVDGYNSVDGGIGVYSQPTTEADITSGPHAGNIYLQWRDTKDGAPYDSDIFFMRSLDTGHTWSEPIVVNDDPVSGEVDQFHNWLVANEEGILVSIWYDQRVDPAHLKFDVFGGYSYDGGETWTSNHRVSSESSSPSLLSSSQDDWPNNDNLDDIQIPLQPTAGLIGEYIALTCVGDIVAAAWTDTRSSTGPGDQEVYSARWHLPLTDPRLIYPLDGETVDVDAPGLFWATAWKEYEDLYQLQIDDDNGFGSPEIYLTVTDNLYDDPLTGLSDGLWYWRIKAFGSPGGIAEETDWSEPGSFRLEGVSCDCGLWGDVNDDAAINPVDVVYMVNFVYKSIDNLVQPPLCPLPVGDVDCNAAVNPVDVVHFVNYVYKSITPFPCVDPCAL